MILDKRFIDEAIRIRTDYLNCMKDILTKEKRVNEHKEEIQQYLNNITEMCKKMEINKEKELNEVSLNKKLMDIEEKIIKIQEDFIPINEKIGKLKKDAKYLYTIIKEKYPTTSDYEIKEQLDPYIIEIDKQIKNY